MVAVDPARFVGIVFERVAVEDRAHLGAAEREAEVAGLRGVDGVHGEAAGLVGGVGKDFEIQTHPATLGENIEIERSKFETNFTAKSETA